MDAQIFSLPDQGSQTSQGSQTLVPEASQILDDLNHAEAHFRSLIARAQQQAQTLLQAQGEAAHLRAQTHGLEAANNDLAQRLSENQAEMTRAQAEARRMHEEAQRMRQEVDAACKENDQKRQEIQTLRGQQAAAQTRVQQLEAFFDRMHRTLLSGDAYSLLLEASLAITGAKRGIYVTRSGEDGPLRVRAAVNVDGYPQSSPSEFLQALCQRVLDTQETLIMDPAEDLADLPPPADTERFHNGVATPVALLKHLDGVIIAADKPDGDFDDDDIQSIVTIGNQASIAAENGQLRRRLQEAYLSTVSVMADAMEAKDPYTQGHSDLVSRLARLAARHLNLSDLDRSVVCFAALLHDIGKIGVSDGLLNKPGPLLPEERELMRTHVRVGHDLIRHVPALGPVAEAVLHHHEFYDGSGYPSGLRGDEIPIASRIVGVVDAYSAMISRRSYKEAYTEDHARAELRHCSGTQFDPRVVEAFLAVLDLPDLSILDEEEEAEYEWLPAFYVARGHSQPALTSASTPMQ